MTTLSFIVKNKIVTFVIEESVVTYFDDIWKHGIKIYPMNESLIKTLESSRSPAMKQTAALIKDANTGKNLEEYNDCKSENDIAKIIRRDCGMQGMVEIK
jgi:hypothetical protein